MKLTASIVIWLIAACYFYGAAVHLFNILSFSGYDWQAAPVKWQVLDVGYLILDAFVVIGLILGWRSGFIAFYVAAISQIFLYTALRDWVTDVPAAFAVSDEQLGHLTGLVIFHVISIMLMSLALWSRARPSARDDVP